MQASIDIGTNTALLLIAEEADGHLAVHREEQRVPRIGAGVDASGKITGDAIERVIEVLNEYQELVTKNFPSVNTVKVTATSAVRDAKNKSEFVESIKEKTGLEISVLSGSDEAFYTFKGAQSVIDDQLREIVVIDIGGGSTEVATGSEELEDRYSYDMGCVRFSERYLKNDPPSEAQIEVCRVAIRRALDEHVFEFGDRTTLIGVAGTVTSMSFIDKKLEVYNSSALDGHILSLESLSDYINRFQNWSSDQLVENYPQVMEGRADIFLAGLLILEEFMLKYRFDELVTSTGGIRHGVLL